MVRGIRKILTFTIRQIASKIFGKIILKPLKFRRDSSSRPSDVRTEIQILYRRLEYISKDLKVISTALKKCFSLFSMYLGGNRRWVPL